MIGRRIKELRTEKGLTQQELAEILNVSSMSISFYENEQRNRLPCIQWFIYAFISGG